MPGLWSPGGLLEWERVYHLLAGNSMAVRHLAFREHGIYGSGDNGDGLEHLLAQTLVTVN
jgi:hypothetical protein